MQEDGIPELLSSVVCPADGATCCCGQSLDHVSTETRGRLDCGLQGISEDVSDERFRGLRIFDISDLEAPVQVGAVQTCGSHTHSVVSGPGGDGKIVVYNSGTSSIREREEMKCFDASPGDPRTALFRIDVIEIPVDDPGVENHTWLTVFADEDGGHCWLWRGGDHGDDTQETRRTDQCHDITVFPSKNIAAGACSVMAFCSISPIQEIQSESMSLQTPGSPTALRDIQQRWHKILFTDEWGGGGRARCRAFDPLDWGADAIYDIVDGKLEYRSHFKMPAPQREFENCVAHNGSIVPVPNGIFLYKPGTKVVFPLSTSLTRVIPSKLPISTVDLSTLRNW